MVRVTERQVFTIDEPPVIRSILDVFSAGVEDEGSRPSGIGKRLEGLARQGCDTLILNLRLVDESLGRTPAGIGNARASLVGGVLVITGQVAAPLMLEIEKLAFQHFFPTNLLSSLNAFVHAFF